MKRKKWLYIVLLIVLVVPILLFYQAFNGNPVTKYASKKALKSFLAEKYSDHEYRINNEFYNFKIGGYTYQVVQIGDEQQAKYEFEVTGFLKPTVTYDGIYYANLDTPLMEKLSEEAAAELTSVLAEKIPEIKDMYVQIEILKGKYAADTEWKKDLKLEKPMYINLTVDVTNMSKGGILATVQTIQQTLQSENYEYDRVSFNGNIMDQTIDGYVKYAIGFDTNTKIKLKDIEEFGR
ncbi:DUF3139 domain-containing protein [Lederbergia citrea]|uniref:YfjL-like protein n=1 Tax=Lederbergia citrea TaxID=2833581 RepID=UPI001BC96250|nr:DUF3139 domain-containing protein [Lederbergia citrea]MBS4204581.1 DUF3139 domain-containing protein [Lederbergia citrea]